MNRVRVTKHTSIYCLCPNGAGAEAVRANFYFLPDWRCLACPTQAGHEVFICRNTLSLTEAWSPASRAHTHTHTHTQSVSLQIFGHSRCLATDTALCPSILDTSARAHTHHSRIVQYNEMITQTLQEKLSPQQHNAHAHGSTDAHVGSMRTLAHAVGIAVVVLQHK